MSQAAEPAPFPQAQPSAPRVISLGPVGRPNSPMSHFCLDLSKAPCLSLGTPCYEISTHFRGAWMNSLTYCRTQKKHLLSTLRHFLLLAGDFSICHLKKMCLREVKQFDSTQNSNWGPPTLSSALFIRLNFFLRERCLWLEANKVELLLHHITEEWMRQAGCWERLASPSCGVKPRIKVNVPSSIYQGARPFARHRRI